VTLTATESALVELLLRRAPAVVSRRSIAVQVWDDEADTVGSNTIDVHMARLRAKLEGAAPASRPFAAAATASSSSEAPR